MDKKAISVFMAYKKPKTWFWGMKDNAMKGFVENFSCVSRRELIDGGSFSERMQWYGGTTQEIRTRFELGRGFAFVFLKEAKAFGIKRAGSKASRRESIVEAKFQVFKMYN